MSSQPRPRVVLEGSGSFVAGDAGPLDLPDPGAGEPPSDFLPRPIATRAGPDGTVWTGYAAGDQAGMRRTGLITSPA